MWPTQKIFNTIAILVGIVASKWFLVVLTFITSCSFSLINQALYLTPRLAGVKQLCYKLAENFEAKLQELHQLFRNAIVSPAKHSTFHKIILSFDVKFIIKDLQGFLLFPFYDHPYVSAKRTIKQMQTNKANKILYSILEKVTVQE